MGAGRVLAGCCWAAVMACVAGCESAPARRNFDVVYRFENLRKQTAGDKSSGPALDEWGSIKPILDAVSVKTVQVVRSGVRTLGTTEVANYEARCVLPTLEEFQKVELELEKLGQTDIRGERVETYLSQVQATYKSNYVLATVNVGVSGASVPGNRVRVYSAPGAAPVETVVPSSGIWVVRLDVVPQTQWVYGSSEDAAGRVPAKYFRINVGTKKQERVDEAAFLKMFPPRPAAPARAAPKDGALRPDPKRDDSVAKDARAKEEEELRKRRAEEDRRFREPQGEKPE